MADRHDVQLRTKLLEKIFPSVDTVDNLESDNPNRPLSARQGKVLKELINAGGGGASGLSIEVVESLPATGVKGILYLVPKTSYLKEENTYDEYVWIESSQKYELLGSFSTDLNIEEYVNKFNSILGEVGEINVATLSDYGINSYVTTGTYRVYGERINSKDGLPILNAANGHTVEGILKVYNSSIAGTGKNTDKVVTQMLSMSNRHGGDGHIWIRTGQGASEDNLTWSTWEKMQGIFEKNTIKNINELDTFTTNGIYSCMYNYTTDQIGNVLIDPGDTLLIVVVNGYMASNFGKVPHLTQTIIHLATENDRTNSIITRSAIWDGSKWKFSTSNDIVLKNFHGNNAYIGEMSISSNVNDDSTLIQQRVKIGPYVAIGTYCTENDWTRIDRYSQLVVDINGFHIKNTSYNASLTLGSYTKLSVKGGRTSSIEYKQDNTMVIDSPSVTLGGGNGPISIGSYVHIGGHISIGDAVNVGRNVVIEDNLYINKDVYIGGYVDNRSVVIGQNVDIRDQIYIGTGVNIGDNVKIINSNNGNVQVAVHAAHVTIGSGAADISIGAGFNVGDGVSIGNGVNIGKAYNSNYFVNIGLNVHLKDNINIENDVNIANNVNIADGIKIVNETNGLKIGTSTGNSLTISTNECSIKIASPNTAGALKFNNNSIITCAAPNIQFGNDTGSVNIGGNVNIAEGFCVEKNTPIIGTITFNENNITFQFGSKSATLQLS